MELENCELEIYEGIWVDIYWALDCAKTFANYDDDDETEEIFNTCKELKQNGVFIWN